MKSFTVPELPGLRFKWFGRLPLDLWIPLKQWVYQRDGGVCQYCQMVTEYEKTHCHHTLELGQGGSNHPSNLKTACHGCHKNIHPYMKSARDRLQETLRQGKGPESRGW